MPSDDDGFLFDLAEFTNAPPPKEDPKADGPQAAGEILADGDGLDIPLLDDALGKELHSLASAVRKSKPWLRLREDDWFAIRDPQGGEIMVVSIMGMAGENIAVQLYLPEEGIRFWNHWLDTGEIDQTMLELHLRMIECEFADRADLEEFDLAAIERFSTGRKSSRTVAGYTMFRSYRPAYYPWPIEAEEAQKIAVALRLVPSFEAFMGAHYGEFYDREKTERPLIPLFSLRKGGDPRKAEDWEISSCPFPEARPEPLADAPRDDLFTARLSGYEILKGGEPWECGAVYMPDTLVHEGRMVFPLATMTYTGGAMIAAPVIGLPDDCRVQLVRRSFSESVAAAGFLPTTVHCQDPVVEVALRELAEQRGIGLQLVAELPELDALVDTICSGQQRLDPALLQEIEALDPDFVKQLTPEFLRNLDQAPPEVLEKLAPLFEAMSSADDDEAGEAHRPEYRTPTSASRYVMRIDLIGAKPPIWRRISMPTDASLWDLHCAIQDAMGWGAEHLHEFSIATGKSKRRVTSFDDDEEFTVTLEHLVKRRKRREIYYLYDFGDNWAHKIAIEKEVEPARGAKSQVDSELKLIGGKGLCPFEDCGGIWGWESLLGGEHHFLEDLEEAEIKRIRENKFDPSEVKFYSAAKSASAWDWNLGPG